MMTLGLNKPLRATFFWELRSKLEQQSHASTVSNCTPRQMSGKCSLMNNTSTFFAGITIFERGLLKTGVLVVT